MKDSNVKPEPRVLVSPDMLEQIDAAMKRHKMGQKGITIGQSSLKFKA